MADHSRISGPPGSRYTTGGGRIYLCHPHHREKSRAATKSIWAITETAECHIFCVTEQREAALVALPAEVWAVARDINSPFGTRGEALARFFPPSPGSTDWHGHPVGKASPGKTKSAPPEVITAWEQAGQIGHALAKQLRKQAI